MHYLDTKPTTLLYNHSYNHTHTYIHKYTNHKQTRTHTHTHTHTNMKEGLLTSQAKSSLVGSRTHFPRKGPNLTPAGTGARAHTPPFLSWSWGGGVMRWLVRPPSSRLRQRLRPSWSPALHSDPERLSSPATGRPQ